VQPFVDVFFYISIPIIEFQYIQW